MAGWEDGTDRGPEGPVASADRQAWVSPRLMSEFQQSLKPGLPTEAKLKFSC